MSPEEPDSIIIIIPASGTPDDNHELPAASSGLKVARNTISGVKIVAADLLRTEFRDDQVIH